MAPPKIAAPLTRDLSHERAGGLRFAQDADKDDEVAPPPVEIVPWRMRERMKTMDVGLVMCLNIGTDPPDIVKSSPCARKECWVEPSSMPPQKALETIGKTLQSQYERWQARARYRQCLDPTVDETKHLCVSMRRHAKNDRVLFHYNGHGVPRPTPNGEIWVFNKSFTQYIPLLVYDLQSWVGTPSIYVFDCSAAGILLGHFNNPPSQPSADGNGVGGMSSSAGEAIVLAACAANEILPMNPELCADVFTSCLTTPITVALRWFISQNEISMSHLDPNFIERIPGKLTDRKTPLGELNWIFTAITDTIAWNILPKELFQKLFRQDLLVASLFRNFLLAERIMKSAGCSPCSLPALPSTHHHPLWRSWDLAAEICLNQLYKISNPHPQAEVSIQPSRFFAEQLTAFEVWLQFGSASKPPPQQLPMVLQVLLSQVHRLRALVLLKKFLDLGPWAVNLALSVGIFPYVLKLLQSPAAELRHVLVFIWTKILALDSSCQIDLVKDDGHSYFISHLAASIQPHGAGGHMPYGHGADHHGGPSNTVPSDQKVMCAFILSVICDNCIQGQKGCLSQYLHKICSNMLADANEDVRKWVCLCLAKLWENFEDGKRVAIDEQMPRILSLRLGDERPEVRAAAAVSLGALLGLQVDATLIGKIGDERHIEDYIQRRAHDDILIATELLRGCQDASPLVRRESVLALANVILHTYHQSRFESVAKHLKNRSVHKRNAMHPAATSTPVLTDPHAASDGDKFDAQSAENSMQRRVSLEAQVDPELVDEIGDDARYYCQIWQALKEIQSRDPFLKVVNAAKSIVSHVNASILASEQEALRKSSVSSAGSAVSTPGVGQKHDASKPGLSMQREGSVPDLPGLSQLQSRGSLGAHPERGPMTGGFPEQGGLRRTGELVQANAAPTSGIRPTQSVGNFRLYQDEHRASDSRGLGSGNQGSVLGNLGQARHMGNPSDQYNPHGSVRPGDSGRQMESNALHPSNLAGLSREFYHPGFQYGRDPNFPPRLRSVFYERHKAHFNEPLMEPVNEGDDPLSEKGAERLERSRRYDRIRKAAAKIAPGFSLPDPTRSQQGSSYSGSYGAGRSVSPTSYMSSSGMPPAGPYSAGSYGVPPPREERDEVKNFTLNLRQRAVLNCDAEMTSLLLFHPHETMLVVADDKDQISLYSFEHGEKKVMTFGNKNPAGSRLTSLNWINESEESLLTCGSDDGVIKIYHGLHTPQPYQTSPKLLSAFVAVPDLVPGTRGSGLITDWQQNAGMFFAGGNSSYLRGWNLRQERCTFSLPTQTDSCITSMTSDETTGGTLVAGFGDGTLRLFDARSHPEYAVKMTMKEHTSWVVQTHVYAGKNEMLSGSVSGELKFWDLRYPRTSVKSLEAHRSPMTALAVHDYAPIFASGSHNQFIKVFKSDGEQLALIRYHEGFLGERIGPVSCLAFHPHRLFLAAGATDSVVAIYATDK
ncbi:Regulatory-associated protein of mtor, partial [Globisporangium splendens]